MRITQIDAFTDRAFAGNPAAVCLLSEFPGDRDMQDLAAEMNLSETAFLVPRGPIFELRWFTPLSEVDLCGHATLAAAHFLWESEMLAATETARFDTRSGALSAGRRGSWIEMDFPAQPATAAPAPPGLLDAMRVKPRFVGRNEADWLIEVGTAEEVIDLRPDTSRIAELCERGVMVTAKAASDEHDFVSRFFAPAVGVAEDPVTGSAHCCLAPYWAGRLGSESLVGYQASRRGGTVRVRLSGDRVILAGQAVTVLQGRLAVPWPDAG